MSLLTSYKPRYFESVRRFQHVLVASGVNRQLREQGVKEGDTVIVGQVSSFRTFSLDFLILCNIVFIVFFAVMPVRVRYTNLLL